MTKRKSIVSKILLAIVALTLISCCFLGSTFARYTSGGTGSAGTSVAKWDVGFDTEGQTEITETKLSPSMGEYKGADDKRTNSTGKILVATITNSGEVKASVTITAGAETVELQSDKSYDTTGYGNVGGELTGKGASQWQVANLFSVELYYDNENSYNDSNGVGAKIEDETTVTLTSGDTVYIFAEITWTSSDDLQEVTSDAIDTWAGENVEKVEYTISYTAVQSSVQPAA